MRLRSRRRAQQAPRPAWLRPALLYGLIALAAVACGNPDAPQDFLSPEGPAAVEIDELWNLVFIIATVVFVLVEGMLLAVLLKFRVRKNQDPTELPKQVEGNTRLEVLWTLIPAVILAAIAVPTVQKIFLLTNEPEGAMEIRVIGKQYWWEFEYGDDAGGVVTANEMVIPTNTDIVLRMESFGQAHEDELGVIHSFWVPKLAGKQDVVPGVVRPLVLRADKPGDYQGQCAEFCGLSHANMRFKVIAMDAPQFDAWVEQQTTPATKPTDAAAQRGYELFEQKGCIGCHAVNGYQTADGGAAEVRVVPNLTYFNDREKFAGYIFDTQDDNALRAWLKDPQAVKPGAQMPNLQLNDEDVDALVAYLRTLSSGE